VINLNEILEAKARLEGVVHKVGLEKSNYFSKVMGGNVYLKYENRQKTGSFKVRGAYNCIAKIARAGGVDTVIAASAGNHAQGVASSAHIMGLKSIIVMPRSTPIAKVLATQGYGAQVILHGDTYDDAYARAKEIEKESGATFIEPFNDIDVIAGQGTIGLEILDEMKNVDIVIVPVGGGGLLAGVAAVVKHINPRVKVIGVQAANADAMVRSFKEGKLVTLPKIGTIADGIAVKKPGDITFNLIKKYADDIVTVTDDEIASTIIELIERTKQIVEPAGATPLAAVLNGKINARGKNVVCVMSGGNVDIGFIHKIIERGLIKRGRQLRLSILMPDIPGGLEKVSGIIAGTNANVVGVHYDRSSPDLQINSVVLHITCEVSGMEHGNKIKKELDSHGFKVI